MLIHIHVHVPPCGRLAALAKLDLHDEALEGTSLVPLLHARVEQDAKAGERVQVGLRGERVAYSQVRSALVGTNPARQRVRCVTRSSTHACVPLS